HDPRLSRGRLQVGPTMDIEGLSRLQDPFMRRIVPTLLIILVITSCSPVATPPSVTKAAPDRTFDDLLGLMRQRLDVMHDVARYKWAMQAPIEDSEREKALLEDVAERGRRLGLDPADTREFFAAQIEAAKLVQRADFRRWEADPRGSDGEV